MNVRNRAVIYAGLTSLVLISSVAAPALAASTPSRSGRLIGTGGLY